MFSKHKIILAIFDSVFIIAGFNFGFWYVFDSGFYLEPRPYPDYYIPSILLAVLIFLTVFQLKGLYKYQAVSNPIHQVQSILQSFLKVLAAFILIVFFMKTKYFADSRLTIGLSFLAAFLLMVLFRASILPRIYFFLVKRGKFRKRTLILGAGEHGDLVSRFIMLNPKSYFQIIGFCDDDQRKIGANINGFPVFGTSYELESIIKRSNIKEIIIAISKVEKSVMLELIDRCKKARLVIHIVSDLYNEVNERVEAEEYGGLRTYRIVPNEIGIVRTAFQRLFNIAGSGIILGLLSPLFLIISYAIKRDSKGPVFYKNEVVGKGGNTFIAYKFRSMYTEGDPKLHAQNFCDTDLIAEGKTQHLKFMENFILGNSNGDCYVKNENRITRVGRFIRKYSLDELPQLINVFKGDMNLVGPRFCTVEEYKFYKPWHKRRFEVNPGITGLWQVSARSEVAYDDMVFLDLYYIENRSLFFDIEILLRTIPVVVWGKGSRIVKEKEKTLNEKVSELSKNGYY